MGLLDWLRRAFKKSPSPAADPEPETSVEPAAASPARAHAPSGRAPASPRVPPAATQARQTTPKPEKKAIKAEKARKPAKAKKAAPAPPPPAGEVLSVEEAERRYGDLVRAAVPDKKPAPAPRARPAPAPAPEPEPPPPAPGPSAADLPDDAAPPAPDLSEPQPTDAERGARARAEAAEHRRLANLPRFQALLSRADALLAVPEVDPRHLLSAKHQLLEDWRTLGRPPAEHADELRAALGARLDALSARGQAGFERRDEERRQNLEQKQALIAELEALASSIDARAAGGELSRIQTAWRQIGPVPREEVDATQAAFEDARQRLLARRQEDRQRQQQELSEQLAQLERLVATAESLAGARDPFAAAERIKTLQATWKTIRPRGAREQVDALWARFRAACDSVFVRRNAAREAETQANIARRQALVDRAVALADGEPPEDPDALIRRLMADWRKGGPVPREVGDALWAQFKAACDRLRTPPEVDLPADDGALRQQPFAGLGSSED